jgi:hypothetical protein
MLTSATEVIRLATRVVRRLDAGLVEVAVRNAETSVLATHHRWLDEMQTLSDLYALHWLEGDVDAAGVAAVGQPRPPADGEHVQRPAALAAV